MKSNYLFYTKGKLSDFLEGQKKNIEKVVLSLPKDEVEKSSPSDLAQAIVQKYTLAVPSLQKNQLKKIVEKNIQIKTQEVSPHQAWKMSRGPRERTVLVDAKEIICDIPFTGDARLFDYQPKKHVFTIPKGDVVDGQLRLRLVIKEEEGVPFDLRIKHQLERIDFYLRGVFDEVDLYNRELPDYVSGLIQGRKGSGKSTQIRSGNDKRKSVSKTRGPQG